MRIKTVPQSELVQYKTFDGLLIRGETCGPSTGPTVVLLHGGGQTRHSWSRELKHLVNDGYRVVSYDARGHGDSDWSATGDYTLQTLARDLSAVIGTIAGPFALVGASMGGMTSFIAAAACERTDLRALILVDIVPRPAAAGAEKILKFMSANTDGFASFSDAVDAVQAYNPHRARTHAPDGLMRNLRQRANGRLYWHWDPKLLGTSPNPEPPTFVDEIIAVSARVTIPTLLVRGGKSDVVDDAGVAELRALLPQTEVYDVPNTGHMVAGDDNSAFHAGIIGFLTRHLPVR